MFSWHAHDSFVGFNIFLEKTRGGLQVKKKSSTIRFQFVLISQSVEMDKRCTLHRPIIQKCPKPVRKFLKELKREALWTMLHFPYCSSMEPALKTVSTSFDIACLIPGLSQMGTWDGSISYYLLLTMWPLWCEAFSAQPFPGTSKINNCHE